MDSDSDGELDPRIQIELENLNKSTDEINKLEIELDVSHGRSIVESRNHARVTGIEHDVPHAVKRVDQASQAAVEETGRLH